MKFGDLLSHVISDSCEEGNSISWLYDSELIFIAVERIGKLGHTQVFG